MTPELRSSSIIPFTWTEQSAVLTTFTSLIPKAQDPTWHINNSILSHPSHYIDLEKALKDYLANNATSDISPLTLWEAHTVSLCSVEFVFARPLFLKKKNVCCSKN